MNNPIGILTAISKNGSALSNATKERFSSAFGDEVQQFTYAVTHTNGGLWQTYENEEYHFFIEGDVFYRNKQLSSGINFNIDFVRDFTIDKLPEIKGNFNIIIIAKQLETAFIITGAHGLKPLFVHHENDVIFVGDELHLFKKALPELSFNEFALAQLILFNFPLGKQSFLTEVNLLPGGYLLTQRNNFKGEFWYDIEASIQGPKLSKKESLVKLRETLNRVVTQSLSPNCKPGLSLTGGFDGRTILSAIRQREQLEVYTFGSRMSSDITVAQEICSQLKLSHHAFYIDDDYCDRYFLDEAWEFIIRSNGIGTHERTHYLHAFKNMADKVDFLLTGNAGSEVFRTILEGGIHVPQLAFDLFQTDDPSATIQAAIEKNIVLKAIKIDAHQYIDRLYDAWSELMGEYKNETNSYRGVYRFFMKESLRKWFGAEMRIENKYCPNRTPFLDEEFLEVLHQTAFSVAYQPFLSQNPVQRKIGQSTYAHILVKNDLDLAKIKTNRGYSPFDVTSVLGVPRIIYSFLTKKKRNRNENSYYHLETATCFFDHFLKQVSPNIPWLDKLKLSTFYTESDTWKKEIRDFSRIVCLALWFNELNTAQSNNPATTGDYPATIE